jgi:hypothetical protein
MNATSSGNTYAITEASFSNPTAQQTVFSFDQTHNRSGTMGSYAQSRSIVVFTVLQDSTYDLTGFYNMAGFDGVGTGDNFVQHTVWLPSHQFSSSKIRELISSSCA